MGEYYDIIEEKLIEWIKKQKIFFVASAPLDANGKVNVSPKGYDALRVINQNKVCYLELTGSGAETQSHVDENGRITIMFCAFEGGPRITRLWGRGRVARVDTPEFNTLLESHYRDSDLYETKGKRAIIVVDVYKVGTSCGFAVPYMEYKGDRPALVNYWKSKSEKDVHEYWVRKNTFSLDGLPSMRHEGMGPEWAPQEKKKKKKRATTNDFFGLTNGSLAVNLSLVGLGVAVGVALKSTLLHH
ncbi:hypothetical protein BGZ94_002425 [Podila epigama]|nr:hypothetical protein BGZ94_002425 [Podila epigama]